MRCAPARPTPSAWAASGCAIPVGRCGRRGFWVTRSPGPSSTNARASVSDTALPVDSVLADLVGALAQGRSAVLEAPPGAGKSTRVPLALLNEPWLGAQTILLLEPRRLAARLVAARLAEGSGRPLGATVGYRVRLERKVSRETRLEVVTEGILTRRLQSDPELAGIGLVIFDEFHERALDTDLGLALCLEVQKALRPDLRLLVMSATLDGQAVARLMGGAPLIRAEGRLFPVEIRYLDKTAKGRFEDEMAALIRRALAEEPGSLLAFLPGEGEIRRVAERLVERGLPADTELAPLYGQLTLDEQERAIKPAAPGRRKIVLATTIAETSLTIEGIRLVVDGGTKRVARFDPNSGLTRLETVKVAKAAAQQRTGRAGRLEPGVAYRLWTEPEDRALEPFDTPAIRSADLAPLALELAQWGESDP
ncbi:MAG: ATP-dependent helicase HrpB, partial [Rhodospirillales bacterium]|nr:ATP-dependent helicase HrpB [Rhodospirillales bacterium]